MKGSASVSMSIASASNRWVMVLMPLMLLVALYHMTRSSPRPVPDASEVPRTSGETPKAPPPGPAIGPLHSVSPSDTPLFGWVHTLGGAALGGATVCIATPTHPGPETPECVRSDTKGRFRFETRPERITTLVASAVGHEPLTQRLNNATNPQPVVLALRPGGLRITGSVVDAEGGVVPGAVVSAGGPSGESAALVIADELGRFHLGVTSEITRVRAQADGYSQRERDVRPPITGIVLVLSAASVVAGRVISEDSRDPVAGVSVTVRGLSGFHAAPRSVQSGAAGEYRIENLSAGRYAIMAFSKKWRSEEHYVSLAVAQVTDAMDVVVRKATPVTGVVSIDGEPCKRGWVHLTGVIRVTAKLDVDGRATFDGVPSGRYEARASCDGALDLTEAFDVGTEPVERGWTLDRGLAVTGVALTRGGEPLAGASVHVSPLGEPSERPNVRCVADTLGEFSCKGLLAGTYNCRIGAGVQPRSENVRVTVTTEASPRIILRADAAASIRVTLREAARFELPAIVLLAQRENEDALLGELHGDQFVFESLALGAYDVWYDSTSRVSPERVQLTRDGQVAELTLSLPPSHEIAGRVLDPAGNGVADAWVDAHGDSIYAGVLPRTAALTDVDGAFSLGGLLPGRYGINVSSYLGEAHIDDVESDRLDVVVRVTPYGSLSGSVISSTGNLVRDFVVAYNRVDDGQGRQLVGSRGAWSIPWLAPGEYDLRITSTDGHVSEIVKLLPGSDLALHLRLNSLAPEAMRHSSGASGAMLLSVNPD
jgi:hypothetical protein